MKRKAFLLVLLAMLMTHIFAANAFAGGSEQNEDAVLHGAFLNYTVQKGDDLNSIALKHYGTLEQWAIDRIYYANYAYLQTTGGNLVPGETILTIPGEGLIVVPEDSMYTVKGGDTFQSIAQKFYGNSSETTVNKIFYANYAYFQKTGGILEAGVPILLPSSGLISPVQDVLYTVRSGDDLAKIALRYYRSEAQWARDRIYYANYSYFQKTGGVLELGAKIVIPAEGQVVGQAAPTAAGSSQAGSSQRVHVVVRGESLSSIARRYYGDVRYWGRIYEANRSQINSPNIIHPGQSLIIP